MDIDIHIYIIIGIWNLLSGGQQWSLKPEPRAGAWAAEANHKIIGYLIGWVWIKRSWRPVKTAELENMFVLPQYRRQGVATALVKEFLNWCKLKKVKSVEVWAQFKNERGKIFYQKCGFTPARQMLEFKVGEIKADQS